MLNIFLESLHNNLATDNGAASSDNSRADNFGALADPGFGFLTSNLPSSMVNLHANPNGGDPAQLAVSAGSPAATLLADLGISSTAAPDGNNSSSHAPPSSLPPPLQQQQQHSNVLTDTSPNLRFDQRPHSLSRLADDSIASSSVTSRDGEVSTTDRFFFTAADPPDGSSEDKLRQYISAKYEAGFLKPYNYVSGYARMHKFMETNLSKPNAMRILKALATFRPAFRAIASTLTDFDLLLVEEGFERMLLDYDHVFNSFGTPACLWRRTGEIYKANREFADMVGIPLHYFHDGRVGIYELLTEESSVNYWEQYGKIAFDTSQKAVLTSCVLKVAPSLIESIREEEKAVAEEEEEGNGEKGAKERKWNVTG
ncbi:Transcription factor, partial [Spiromyces aspiralis]